MTLNSPGFGDTMLLGSSPHDRYHGGCLGLVGTLWGPQRMLLLLFLLLAGGPGLTPSPQ